MPRPDLLITSIDNDGDASAIVTVTCGAMTLAFQICGKVVTPLRVRLKVPLNTLLPVPKPSSRNTTSFRIVRAAVIASRDVLFAIVRVPVPTGPLMIGPGARFGVLSDARASPPALIV